MLRARTIAGTASALRRPASMPHALPAALIRGYASESNPKAKADSIIASLPGNSVLGKSGILATGFAASTYAIANSLYVLNAETCLLAVFAGVFTIAAKTVAPGYKQWAESHIENIKNTLNKAREEHVVAVQDRIDGVKLLDEVVPTTKALFAVSKQTVELEAEAFELKQRVDFAAKAKEVLDSWVRYEANVRQREQEDLVKTVLAKVEAAVDTDKFQQDTLKQAISEIEKLFKSA